MIKNFFSTSRQNKMSSSQAEGLYEKHVKGGTTLKTVAKELKVSPDLAREVRGRFYQAKRRQNVVYYPDMIREATRLCRKNLQTRSYRIFPKLLLVDESQDLNASEIRFVLWLEKTAETAILVGDDRQGIYGFRRAVPESVRTLRARIKGCQYQTRSYSYRLTNETAAWVNACSNKGGYPKIRTSKTGEKPLLVLGSSRENAYWAFADEISGLVQRGVPPENIAVISRYWSPVKQFGLFLARKDIPVSSNSLTKDEKKAIEHFCFFLEAVKDLSNTKLASYLHEQKGLTKAQAQAVSIDPSARIRRQDLGLVGTRGNYVLKITNTIVDCRKGFGVEKLIRKFKANLQGATDASTYTSIPHILTRYGMLDLYEENLEAVLKAFSAFLTGKAKKGVDLETIHSSKGKDWDFVFVIDLHDEAIFKRFYWKPSEIEEENNFHVAVTRPKKRLYMTFFAEVDPKAKENEGDFKRNENKELKNTLLRFFPEEKLLKKYCEIKRV